MELGFKNIKTTVRGALLVVLITVISYMGLVSFKTYENPKLTGEWMSEETGRVIQFTEKGKVRVNDIEEGTYTIESPESMNYQIGGYSFKMTYELSGRTLLWGVAGQEIEKFKRK